MRGIPLLLLALVFSLASCGQEEELPKPASPSAQSQTGTSLPLPELPPRLNNYPPAMESLEAGTVSLWSYQGKKIPGQAPWFFRAGLGYMLIEGRQVSAYTVTEDSGPLSFNPASLGSSWSSELPAFPAYWPIVDQDRMIWTLRGYGVLVISARTGREQWSLPIEDLDPRDSRLVNGILMVHSQELGLGYVDPRTGSILGFDPGLGGEFEWIGPDGALRREDPSQFFDLYHLVERETSDPPLPEARLLASSLLGAQLEPDGKGYLGVRTGEEFVMRAERYGFDGSSSTAWEREWPGESTWSFLRPPSVVRAWTYLLPENPNEAWIQLGNSQELVVKEEIRVLGMPDPETAAPIAVPVERDSAGLDFQLIPERSYLDERSFLLPVSEDVWGLRMPNALWLIQAGGAGPGFVQEAEG